jgi:hypothetical protein
MTGIGFYDGAAAVCTVIGFAEIFLIVLKEQL